MVEAQKRAAAARSAMSRANPLPNTVISAYRMRAIGHLLPKAHHGMNPQEVVKGYAKILRLCVKWTNSWPTGSTIHNYWAPDERMTATKT